MACLFLGALSIVTCGCEREPPASSSSNTGYQVVETDDVSPAPTPGTSPITAVPRRHVGSTIIDPKAGQAYSNGLRMVRDKDLQGAVEQY
ncbi:MAG: hypothetical protein VB878_09820, partial [Pirellulaceae bacterium]